MPFPRLRLFLLLLFLTSAAAAQQPAAKPPAVDDEFVQKQFGSTCKLIPGSQVLTGDLDGDGVEDMAVAAHCSNPMLDEAENNFAVIDPYNAFYGYDNPRLTSTFSTEDPQARGIVLLIIHGSGAEAWRSATPKAKFVVINLPFKHLAIRKMVLKKGVRVTAIYAEETGDDRMTSAVFWDGRRYRYAPMGSGLD